MNFYQAPNRLLNQPTKRRAFFSFHYDDIMRVNNVRNAWKIDHPDSPLNRSFYDSSLWKSKKLTSPDQIKNLIREGLNITSAVCVLVGSETWKRRWVKYEIARSVIDERGLLAVHINGLNHHQRQCADQLGYNPVKLMGLARTNKNSFCLCEWMYVQGAWKWQWYADHTTPVKLPKYMPEPQPGNPLSLSNFTLEYDFARQQGSKNIGGWIDLAASLVGR